MSFIRTGLREIGLKIRRQRTRLALRHEKRLLQRSEINLGREGTSQAANFPELRNEIVALKKLEQEQKEVARRIAQIEEAIKKVETDLENNAREKNETLAKMEHEKKPILQQRDGAKSAADICTRELAGIERRIENNDAADRDILKELSALQAMVPPPGDLDAKTASLGARRARLPEERAELVRARMGSSDACRVAQEKLTAAEADLSNIEKNIERVRGEYEAREKAFNESIKSQQEAIRDARAHHQTVEERKNPAYLNIGRHLATQGIAPPNAPHLLNDVQRHRGAVDRHVQHASDLALLSSQIDKQELRKFYFSVFSIVFLLPIFLLLVWHSSAQREWLPQESEAILSVNVDQFEKGDLPKRWRKEQPERWDKFWAGLIGSASRVPAMNLSRDAIHVTRALATDNSGKIREFVLIEGRSDVTPVIRSVGSDRSFERKTIGGLAVWERPDLALARLGPATLAVGSSSEVNQLVQVRLGIQSDLKITAPLFDRFQALDRDSAVRLISRDPRNLTHIIHPVLPRELLESVQLLGLSVNFSNPARGRLLLRFPSPVRATQAERDLQKEPQRWLRLPDSDLVLCAQPPDVARNNNSLEIHCSVPENSVRLLLERIAGSDTATVVAAQ